MLEINNLKEFLSQSDEYHDITWFEQQADNGAKGTVLSSLSC